jgi:hypothetical protein
MKLIRLIVWMLALHSLIMPARAGKGLALPPSEFDRPYAGNLIIVQGGDQEGMRKLCPRIAFPFYLGCTYPAGDRCLIVLADELDILRAGWTLDVVKRHEIGHCNGWGADHKGAMPHFEILPAANSRLSARLVSSS